MFDMTDFIKLIKKTAVEAVNASKPADIVFGKVISVAPLKIKVDQKLILGTSQLVLSRNVTNHIVKMIVDPPEIEDPEVEDPEVGVEGRPYLICNALAVGEKVALFQLAGGQKYFVIDRIRKG